MSSWTQTAAKSWLPPKLHEALRGRFGNRFVGDYATWAEATADCAGYGEGTIVERVAEAVRAVETGQAACERDGVLFDRIEYSWPALACLLSIAAGREGALSVIDFGGSLGTSYRQNRKFLRDLREVSWAVVEQPSFVEAGKREFQSGPLRFFDDLSSAIATTRPDVIFLSGVLQYLPDPEALLRELVTRDVRFLLFDRTPLIEGDRHRLTIQRVPRHINRASYPAWFFSRSRFSALLDARFDLLEEFRGSDRANIAAEYTGSLWRLRPTEPEATRRESP